MVVSGIDSLVDPMESADIFWCYNVWHEAENTISQFPIMSRVRIPNHN